MTLTAPHQDAIDLSGGRVFVAGHLGLVGSALVRACRARGIEPIVRPRADLDLLDEPAVVRFFLDKRPDFVLLAAARVGGIHANNTQPVEFLLDNLKIQNSVIESAHAAGVRKLLFLGSSCIYPRLAPQPIREDALLTGPLEPTNEAYAIAKIAGIKLCQAYRREYGCSYIACMPTNLYGPNDNFDLATSHVLPALIRRFHEALRDALPEVVLWGTGSPRREFLHVDDMADACLFLMERYDEDEVINVGSGEDLTIGELAGIVREVVGYTGAIRYDSSKPDGTPRKLLDVTKLRGLGWAPRIRLHEGIAETYAWYVRHAAESRS